MIDSGPTTVGLESTVLDLTGLSPQMLRPGPITGAELEAALAGRAVLDQPPGRHAALPMSPGQMPVHYAPRTPAYPRRPRSTSSTVWMNAKHSP